MSPQQIEQRSINVKLATIIASVLFVTAFTYNVGLQVAEIKYTVTAIGVQVENLSDRVVVCESKNYATDVQLSGIRAELKATNVILLDIKMRLNKGEKITL